MSKFVPRTGPIALAVMKAITEQDEAFGTADYEWRMNYARIAPQPFSPAQDCALFDMTPDFSDYSSGNRWAKMTRAQRAIDALVSASNAFTDYRSR